MAKRKWMRSPVAAALSQLAGVLIAGTAITLSPMSSQRHCDPRNVIMSTTTRAMRVRSPLVSGTSEIGDASRTENKNHLYKALAAYISSIP